MFAEIYGPAPLLGRLLDLRARADYELGESVLPREAIVHNIGEVESFVARCAEIVAEEEAHGADEPDPPADY